MNFKFFCIYVTQIFRIAIEWPIVNNFLIFLLLLLYFGRTVVTTDSYDCWISLFFKSLGLLKHVVSSRQCLRNIFDPVNADLL